MKVKDLPGWPPQPFAQFNLEELSFEQMGAIVDVFWHEVKRRNPIGVNAYSAAFTDCRDVLYEIGEAETVNPTCDAGPTQAREDLA